MTRKPPMNVPVYEGICTKHQRCRLAGRPVGIARCPLCRSELKRVRHVGWAMREQPEWEAFDAKLREQRSINFGASAK